MEEPGEKPRTTERALRVVECEYVGMGRAVYWELRDADDNLLADIDDYRTFMRAWMDAPMGVLKVEPLEGDTHG